MTQWKLVKLELAPNGDYPNGSPARAFLLRLPLSPVGMIDRGALSAEPKGAFVRRFWPNEADRSGTVRRSESGWALEFPDGERNARFEDVPIVPEGIPELSQADGTRLPFRVVTITPD